MSEGFATGEGRKMLPAAFVDQDRSNMPNQLS